MSSSTRCCLFVALLLNTALFIHAQVVKPRANPADYPATAKVSPGIDIAAESLARSVPTEQGVLFAPDHLVIEVAFFGPSLKGIKMSPGQFSLTVDGKKIPLQADTPGSVSSSMRDTPWNMRPNLEAAGSINNSGVIIGGRRPTTGIPDLDQRGRGPSAPRAPSPEDRSGRQVDRTIDVNKAVLEAALTECECKPPVAGLLYFPYGGKLKSIKSLVLHYAGVDGVTTAVDLKLLP
jgi:hypothetical protein